MIKSILIFTVACCFSAFSSVAQANISTTPWIHKLFQVGQDVEVTVSIFEESSEEFIIDDVPFPELDDEYSLIRWGTEDGVTLFADRVFTADEADVITDYECHGWYPEFMIPEEICTDSPEHCVDCDADGEVDCYGFCAVAYRFKVIDECVPPGEQHYSITTPSVEGTDWNYGEGLGRTNTGVEDTGDVCLGDDEDEDEDEDAGVTSTGDEFDNYNGGVAGCSVSGVGVTESPTGWLALF